MYTTELVTADTRGKVDAKIILAHHYLDRIENAMNDITKGVNRMTENEEDWGFGDGITDETRV